MPEPERPEPERRRPRPAVLVLAAVVLAVVAVVVLIGLGGGRRAPVLPALLVGVAANTQDTNTPLEQDAARAVGFQILREEIRWPAVEPRRGHFDDRRYDRLTTLAARRGLRILPLLFKTPSWLAAKDTTLPPSLPLWERFVRHVVGRYGPGGAFWRAHPALDGRLAMRTWEVWNEPYYVYFSAGGVDPAAYARLVRATVRAGHAANPGVGFLASLEAGYDPGDGSVRNWARDLFAADPGLGRVLAGIAVHPYAPAGPLVRTGPLGDRFSRIRGLLAIARRHGLATPRPLWITELGWSTCPAHPPCVSLGDQAEFWSQALDQVARPPLRRTVAAVVVYDLRNLGRSGPADPLGDFGIITLSGRHKPAWAVLRRAALQARAAARGAVTASSAGSR